jgi:hypothetical protein
MRPNRIRIEYVEPQNKDNVEAYNLLKERRALERLQQLFSPVRLPAELTLKTQDCGMVNAFYKRPTLTICYEMVNDVLKNVPKETTAAGITPHDAAVGQFAFIAAHEMGHALFDQLMIPLMGREEDAADQVAAYILLAAGKQDARKLIGGAAYSFHNYMKNPQVTLPVTAFSDAHGASPQRFYNLLCIAYGADPDGFADIVKDGYLPDRRAKNCAYEYWNVRYAFQQLIRPYLDPGLVSTVLSSNLFEQINPPQRQSDTQQVVSNDQAKSDQAKSDQAKSDQAKADQAKTPQSR